jgi:hypothetical protein
VTAKADATHTTTLALANLFKSLSVSIGALGDFAPLDAFAAAYTFTYSPPTDMSGEDRTVGIIVKLGADLGSSVATSGSPKTMTIPKSLCFYSAFFLFLFV